MTTTYSYEASYRIKPVAYVHGCRTNMIYDTGLRLPYKPVKAAADLDDLPQPDIIVRAPQPAEGDQ
jgi:hypothetical protein